MAQGRHCCLGVVKGEFIWLCIVSSIQVPFLEKCILHVKTKCLFDGSEEIIFSSSVSQVNSGYMHFFYDAESKLPFNVIVIVRKCFFYRFIPTRLIYRWMFDHVTLENHNEKMSCKSNWLLQLRGWKYNKRN